MIRAGVVRVCVRFLSNTRSRRDFERPWELRRDALMGLILSNRGIERNGKSLPWWKWYGIPKPTPEEAFYAATVYVQKAWWIYRNPNAHPATTRPAVSRCRCLRNDEAAAGSKLRTEPRGYDSAQRSACGAEDNRGAVGLSGETETIHPEAGLASI